MPGVLAKFFWKGKWIDSRLDYRMKISVERDVTDNLHPPVVVQILLDPQEFGEVSILTSLVMYGLPGLNATSGSCSFLGFAAFRVSLWDIWAMGVPRCMDMWGFHAMKKMCIEFNIFVYRVYPSCE